MPASSAGSSPHLRTGPYDLTGAVRIQGRTASKRDRISSSRSDGSSSVVAISGSPRWPAWSTRLQRVVGNDMARWPVGSSGSPTVGTSPPGTFECDDPCTKYKGAPIHEPGPAPSSEWLAPRAGAPIPAVAPDRSASDRGRCDRAPQDRSVLRGRGPAPFRSTLGLAVRLRWLGGRPRAYVLRSDTPTRVGDTGNQSPEGAWSAKDHASGHRMPLSPLPENAGISRQKRRLLAGHHRPTPAPGRMNWNWCQSLMALMRHPV